jgi:hypothetical protein
MCGVSEVYADRAASVAGVATASGCGASYVPGAGCCSTALVKPLMRRSTKIENPIVISAITTVTMRMMKHGKPILEIFRWSVSCQTDAELVCRLGGEVSTLDQVSEFLEVERKLTMQNGG